MAKSLAILGPILLLALCLRLWGLGFGGYHGDERSVVSNAQRIIGDLTLDPDAYRYGALVLHVQALAFLVTHEIRAILGMTPTPGHHPFLIARAISALAGVATVALAALLARAASAGTGSVRREEDRIAAPLAALIVAVSFVSVQCSHYATVDTLMTTLATSSVLLALRAQADGRTRFFLLAGLLAGLAAGAKYTGILSALPLATIPFVARRGERPWRATALGLTAVCVGFALAMPYAFLEPGRTLDAITHEGGHYAGGFGTIFATGPHTGLWNAAYLYHTGLGPGLAVIALASLGWLVRRLARGESEAPDWRRCTVLLVYPVTLFVFLSCFPTRFDRNLLPVIPFAAVVVGLFANAVFRWAGTRPLLARASLVVVFALAILHPLSRDVVFDHQITRPHTRRQLAQWIDELPRKKKTSPHGYLQSRSLGELRAEGFDYAVMSSHSEVPVALHPERYPDLAARYAEITANGKLVATFSNPWFDSDFFAPAHLHNSATVNIYHGPTLTVYRVSPVTPRRPPAGR